MNNSELRIGNLALVDYGDGFKESIIESIHKDYGVNFETWNGGECQEWYKWEPITITEEKLLQLGFSIDEDVVNWNEPDYVIYKNSSFQIGVLNGRFFKFNPCYDDFYSTYYPEFKYVHKLQNYYFENTDKELIYNQGYTKQDSSENITLD